MLFIKQYYCYKLFPVFNLSQYFVLPGKMSTGACFEGSLRIFQTQLRKPRGSGRFKTMLKDIDLFLKNTKNGL